jgi:hypothetical protein
MDILWSKIKKRGEEVLWIKDDPLEKNIRKAGHV